MTAVPLVPLAKTYRMQWRERFQRTLQLWPYMAPLALVYFAEYVLQVHPIAISTLILVIVAYQAGLLQSSTPPASSMKVMFVSAGICRDRHGSCESKRCP